MCVLLVKPEGVKMPSYSTLKACAIANPDGFGFVSTKRYFKSMNFFEFYKELMKVKDDEKAIIHFRWATHGSKRVANCHPFHSGDIWFAHNGVLDIETSNDKTDSETAFRSIIMPAIKMHGFNSEKMLKATNIVRGGSRFAIFDRKNNEILALGDFTSINGVYYSNTRWQWYLECTKAI